MKHAGRVEKEVVGTLLVSNISLFIIMNMIIVSMFLHTAVHINLLSQNTHFNSDLHR